jgi:hypothetical protein
MAMTGVGERARGGKRHARGCKCEPGFHSSLLARIDASILRAGTPRRLTPVKGRSNFAAVLRR